MLALMLVLNNHHALCLGLTLDDKVKALKVSP